MKKVTAIAIYKREGKFYNLCVLTVNYKGDITTLDQYPREGIQSHNYNDFSSMYKSVLKIMKNNNFYCGMYEDFGVKWYDIQWIDYNNAKYVNKYPLMA